MLEISVITEGNNLKSSRKPKKINESRERCCGWEFVSLFIPAVCSSPPFSQSSAFLFFSPPTCRSYARGEAATTAARGSAAAEPRQEYPRSSRCSPPSHRRHFAALVRLNISARQSEACVIHRINPGSAPSAARHLAPSTCAGIHPCMCARSFWHSSATEAAS